MGLTLTRQSNLFINQGCKSWTLVNWIRAAFANLFNERLHQNLINVQRRFKYKTWTRSIKFDLDQIYMHSHCTPMELGINQLKRTETFSEWPSFSENDDRFYSKKFKIRNLIKINLCKYKRKISYFERFLWISYSFEWKLASFTHLVVCASNKASHSPTLNSIDYNAGGQCW